MEPGKLIGQKIKRAREAEGLSQPELGERLGESLSKPWSRQAVFLAEKGERSFPAEELYALAIALDRPIYYFLIPDPGDDFEIKLPKRRLKGLEVEDVVLGGPSEEDEPRLSAERERNWRVWAGMMQRAADHIADDAAIIYARLSHIRGQADLARGLARFGPLLDKYDAPELTVAIPEAEDRLAEKEQK
jgi:transcriptional regulator with XRE-family HTH domain